VDVNDVQPGDGAVAAHNQGTAGARPPQGATTRMCGFGIEGPVSIRTNVAGLTSRCHTVLRSRKKIEFGHIEIGDDLPEGRFGNPDGGLKIHEKLGDRIGALFDDAVTFLEQVPRDDDVRVRLMATQTPLDLGYGLPGHANEVTLTTKQDASQSHLNAFELIFVNAGVRLFGL
jgi:hypothetical protein